VRKIFLLLTLCSLIFAESIFTLENTNNLKVYMADDNGFITQEQTIAIKKIAENKLRAAGIELNKIDASTFMVKVESCLEDME